MIHWYWLVSAACAGYIIGFLDGSRVALNAVLRSAKSQD